ncbi:YhdP family protein [Planctobacterium marinum]|uniref:YhdP family protein n=1 Tax=Planctobacterium marinum TaxID=1631968 RepID=UPI001E57AA48|nr:YhdP family protein [Planctobacterium marinum]MCC2608037.1 TIGR02099 family protein [Planctobacterium marinum]
MIKDWRFYAAWITRKIWMSAAVLLVTLAVLISLVRYSLPYMDSHKHHLESFLQEQYNSDIQIGYISAMWKGKGPAIVLKDVVLKQEQDSPISFSIDETQIELDFWSSVQQRQIQSQRFNLIGLQLQVDLPKIESSGEQYPILDALQTLFLEQLARFSVSNSEVLLKTRLDEQKIQIQQLSWLNKEQRHQGVGQMRVAELARNSARFVLDLHGSKDSFDGTFYAEAEDLDLSPWIKALLPTEYNIQHSRGNFKLWAGMQNTQISFVQADLSQSEFVWQGEDKENAVSAEVLKGQFYAMPNSNGWDFNLDDFSLVVNERLFTSDWHGSLFTNGVVTLSAAESFNLSPLLPLSSVLLGESFQHQLAAFDPNVQVNRADFYLSEDYLGSYLAFDDLSIQEQPHIPGINDVFGELFWLNDNGVLNLQSEDSYLAGEQLLGFVVPYQTLTLSAFVNTKAGESRILIPDFELQSQDLHIQQQAEYDLQTGNLTLSANVQDTDLSVVKGYFPDLMGQDTRSWLIRALEKGQTRNANILWRGNPADFPFEQGQGIFQASVDIAQLQLKFQPDWPALEEAYVSLLFENDSLTISGKEGRISGLDVQQVQAVIPQLSGSSYVAIDADGQGSGVQITDLFNASSLKDSVGQALNFLQVKGDMQAKLNLHIPFNEGEVMAQAQVNFQDNQLHIPDLNLTLNDLNGALSIANENLDASGITASFLGQSIALDVKARQQEQGYTADVNFSGDWDVPKAVLQAHPQLAKYVHGNTQWDGKLNLVLPEQGYQYNLQLHSQLAGVDLNAPQPLAKEANTSLPLFFDSEGDEQVSTVRILLGRNVKFNGILPHDTLQFSRAHLSVGGDNFVGMGLGFSVSADLPRLDYSGWHAFIGDLVDGLPDNETPFISAPQRVFVEAQELLLAGQVLTGAEVLAKNRENLWELEVSSEQARADITLHKNWLRDGVEIEADYINLTEWQDSEAQTVSFSDGQVPPLKLLCKSCNFKGIELGRVEAEMSRSQSGMKIDKLNISSRDGSLMATGDWYFAKQNDSTRLIGSFNSEDFGSFLKRLDFDSGIRDSDAAIDFDFSWGNAPYAFSAADLNGNLDFRLGDGYITEISDKGARLLSIFSLESLLRKLTLDFRDVFAKGFFYDNMSGTFAIEQGKVRTQDTHIDGAAAGVDIKGYANLVDSSLNYVVDVKPNITSSLPVLVAWMVNPATAVAALAFDEVFTSANVVSGIQYSLTGSIKEPQITLLEQTSKVVELPAKNNNAPTRNNPAETQPNVPQSQGRDDTLPDEVNNTDSDTESGK